MAVFFRNFLYFFHRYAEMWVLELGTVTETPFFIPESEPLLFGRCRFVVSIKRLGLSTYSLPLYTSKYGPQLDMVHYDNTI